MSQALSAADVARVSVTVNGPGMSPASFELTREESGFRGTLAGIAAGANRVFEARAFDSAGTAVYGSRSDPTTIVAGQTATVILLLQQLTPPPDFQNTAPSIEAVTVSSNRVLPGDSVELAVRAIDPDAGDTLSYRWSAAEGAFSAPTAATTRWTAPATEAERALTITVTDAQGSRSTLTLKVNVTRGQGAGTGEVHVSFNSWPSVTGMTAAPSQLVVGQPLVLTATGHDPDGDLLSSGWTSSCDGTFNDAASAPRTFTLASAPASGTCTFTVVMSDGRGGSGRGLLTLGDGHATTNFGPSIDSYYQSSADALARETLTLRLEASDPEGAALTFSWSAGSGTLGIPTSGASSSELTWTAPACLDQAASVVATVTDAAGVAASHTFTIAPRDTEPCGGRNVRGVRTARYYLQDGSVIVEPVDMSTAVVAAHVPRADGSGYDVIAGQGLSDGTVLVQNVPTLPVLLQVDNRYQWLTSYSAPDVFFLRVGRPDVRPALEGTVLDIELTGLAPWGGADQLYFQAPNADAFFDLGCDGSATFPEVGGTEARHALRFSECNFGQPLLEGDKGDVLWAGQYAGRATADLQVNELRRSGEAPVTMVQGTSTPFHLALTEGTASDVQLDLRAPAFKAQAGQPFTDATDMYLAWDIAMGPSYADIGVMNIISLASGSVTSDASNDVSEPLHYAAKPPAGWGYAAYGYAASYTTLSLPARADGSIPRLNVSTFVNEYYEYSRPVSGTLLLAPALGAVQSLRVNGQPATSLLTGVGTTPTLSWSAPLLGTASSYWVALYRAVDTGSSVNRFLVARFSRPASAGTTLKLPAGLVQPGTLYYVVVGASSGENLDGSPDGRVSRSSETEMLSHFWTP